MIATIDKKIDFIFFIFWDSIFFPPFRGRVDVINTYLLIML